MPRILHASFCAAVLICALACGSGGNKSASPEPPDPANLVFPVEALQTSGEASKRINLVVLGDGYREQDQAKLTQDAQAWLTAFRNTAPYGNYAEYFNVKLIHVASNEDGADNGTAGLGVARDTALGASFQNANPPGLPPDYRLLVVDNARALAVAMANAPEFSKVLVLVNDAKYGGSGGLVPVFSANQESCRIALHEFGHSFGGLADEYSCGDTSPLPASIEAYPNITTAQALDQIKWNRWILPGTLLPTPEDGAHFNVLGLFQGGYYHDGGIYRPKHACRMRSLEDEFCEVCSEAIIRGVYSRIALIDAASPASPVALDPQASVTLSIAFPAPVPNTLAVNWSVDGVGVMGTGGTYVLQGSALTPGAHAVSARLCDGTRLVRGTPAECAHTWTVNVSAAAPLLPVATPASERHLMVLVIRDVTGLKVLDQKIIEAPCPVSEAGTWAFELQDIEGRVLFRQGLEDPSALRGEFRNAEEPRRIDGHHRQREGPVSFILRVPVIEASHLEVFEKSRKTGESWAHVGSVKLAEAMQP